jgi:hypothetical protein
MHTSHVARRTAMSIIALSYSGIYRQIWHGLRHQHYQSPCQPALLPSDHTSVWSGNMPETTATRSPPNSTGTCPSTPLPLYRKWTPFCLTCSKGSAKQDSARSTDNYITHAACSACGRGGGGAAAGGLGWGGWGGKRRERPQKSL